MNTKSYYKTHVSMNNFFYSDYWIGVGGAAFSSVLAFFLPVFPFLSMTVILVLCDLYTGTRAAIARNEKLTEEGSPIAVHPSKVLHSRGYRRTIEKISVYFIAILVSELMTKTFHFGEYIVPLTYMMSFAIAVVEYKSVLENIQEITGNDKLITFIKEYIIRKK